MNGTGGTWPLLPPAYRAVAVGGKADPFVRACADAREAPFDGALFWSRRKDRLDCALVLVPEAAVERSLAVACVAMVGLGDALGALVAPNVPVEFRWPDQLHVNGALAGGLRLAWGEGGAAHADHGWIVLGATVAIAPRGDEPGRTPERTTLYDEGCGEIGALDLLEAFSRHLLAWVNRWQEDGFAPVRAAWLGRAPDSGKAFALRRDEDAVAGRMIGLDDDGGLILDTGGKQQRTIPLADVLRRPTWSL